MIEEVINKLEFLIYTFYKKLALKIKYLYIYIIQDTQSDSFIVKH